MAKKSKIKQQGKQMPKKNSRTEQEQCTIVAKKILQHFGLDTKLLDVFTKKQKERLSKVYYITPSISADKPGTVPRQYLKTINSEAYKFMKTNFWGNSENELTFFELATFGLSFLSTIQGMFKEENLFEPGTPQYESASCICEKFDRDELMNEAFQDVSNHIFYISRGFSRVNFRMYGHIMDCEKLPDKRCNCGHCFVYKVCYKITVQECETKDFSINNIYRKTYRLFRPADGLYLPKPLTIQQNEIFKREKEEKVFNMYVQSHVFHRFRERLDVFSPSNHNLLFQYAFSRYLKLVQYDNRDLFACLIDDDAPVGYFTFLIRGDDIVVNTFLPLVGENTPEGKKLQKLLSLSKEEITYLGMDKLSFFTTVDFEQIPQLKQALIDSNIWKTKLAIEELFDEDEMEENKSSIDMNKTTLVKKFFDKMEEYRSLF
ncbi:hypothetical protein AGMMS50239_02890 [Bacteroidia bacterium]|nr:hypothetical protein AGMMS50239_02890 [Bacteroidia bacterium]